MADHLHAGLRCSDVADLAAAFVLGALEADESAAVRQHLAACPEAHPEIAELHSVVPALFEAAEPATPPAALRQRILDAAAAETRGAADTRQAVETRRTDDAQRAAGTPSRAGQPMPAWRRLFLTPAWAAVGLAAIIGVLALGAWSVRLQGEIAALATYRDGVVAVLDAAAEPEAQLAVLRAEGGGPSGLAAWGADGTVALVMRDLAPTTGSQVYETWLIAGDGVPIPIGGFAVGVDGTASFRTNHVPLGEGVTVALTLEAAPNATTPTLPIIAAGTARSQSS